jgi:hypothetical protein
MDVKEGEVPSPVGTALNQINYYTNESVTIPFDFEFENDFQGTVPLVTGIVVLALLAMGGLVVWVRGPCACRAVLCAPVPPHRPGAAVHLRHAQIPAEHVGDDDPMKDRSRERGRGHG